MSYMKARIDNVEHYKNFLKTSKHISEENRAPIERFVNECYAQGLSDARIRKYLNGLHKILKISGKDFKLLGADTDALKFLVAKITQASRDDGGPISPWYRNDLKGTVKKFYTVMEPDEDGEPPKKIKWIKLIIKKSEDVLPEPLSRKEIDLMIDNSQNDRMSCMLMVLYEAGLRAGELLSMRIKDVEFVENGVRINVNGKTGNRRVLLIESERYIKNWISKHPYRGDGNSPLWVKLSKNSKTPMENRIGYNTFRILFKRVAIRAEIRTKQMKWGVTSDLHPHVFRHSRATHLASKLKEATMKEFFGWTQASDMAQRYVHLSGRDVDNEIMGLYGIQEKLEEMKPVECPRCFKVNKDADFCSRCAMPLTWDAAKKKEEARTELQAIIELMVENGITKEKLSEIFQQD